MSVDQTLYVDCSCGSLDHVIRFWRDDEDILISVQMSPYLPFLRRVLAAVQYVFGFHPKCHWADTVIGEEDRARVVRFLSPTQETKA